MSEFSIFSGATLVGTSRLEYGDPPMGVAFGRFIPAVGYSVIQAQCKLNYEDQSNLHLTVRAPSGEVLQCSGVSVLEGNGEIEVNVLGVSYPEYAELFPQHVGQYEASLK